MFRIKGRLFSRLKLIEKQSFSFEGKGSKNPLQGYALTTKIYFLAASAKLALEFVTLLVSGCMVLNEMRFL